MAATKDAVEFNKIIHADRDKKKKQDLADRIFSRRSSAPAAGAIGIRKGPAGPSSLASRITKPGQNVRSAKAANPLARVQSNAATKRSVSTPPQVNNIRRNQALDILVNGRSGRADNKIARQASLRTNPPSEGAGFSIKGSASQPREYIVVAQNFALGTTADDISSVFAPDPDAAGLISCQLLVSQPTVIAELIFDNQTTADDVVKSYNGKKADNRVLYVYHSDAPTTRASRQLGLSARAGAVPINSDSDSMDVDDARSRHRQPPTGPQPQRARPEVQDGRYGFGDNVYRPRHEARREGGLVSDSMISRQGNKGRNDGGNRQQRR